MSRFHFTVARSSAPEVCLLRRWFVLLGLLVGGVFATSTSASFEGAWRSISPERHEGAFNDLRFFAGFHVGTTNRGTILISPDGLEWQTVAQVGFVNPLGRLTVGRDALFAVSSTGLILRSTDSVNWAVVLENRERAWTVIVDTGTRYQAVAADGEMWGSVDGVSWAREAEQRVAAGSFKVMDVAFGNGVYVAFRQFSFHGEMLYSTDGINWTDQFIGVIAQEGFSNSFEDVEFANGQFVMVGGRHDVVTSVDGANWSVQDDVIGLPGIAPKSVRYLDGAWWLAGPIGAMRSTDGLSWTKHVTGLSAYFTSYGNGVFLSEQGRSEDGSSWQSNGVPVAGRFTDVGFGQGQFWISGIHGVIWTSRDGLSWMREFAPSGKTMNAIYADEDMVIIAGWDGSIQTRRPDGTWSLSPYDNGKIVWRVEKFKDQFHAFANDGRFVSDDGIAWTYQADRGANCSTVHGDVMLVGGPSGLWRTTDGVDFTKVSISGNWPLSLTYFNGRFFGYSQANELSSSGDGINWTLHGKFYAHAGGLITLETSADGLPSTSTQLPGANQFRNGLRVIDDELLLSLSDTLGSIASADGRQWRFDPTPYRATVSNGERVVSVAGDDKVAVRAAVPSVTLIDNLSLAHPNSGRLIRWEQESSPPSSQATGVRAAMSFGVGDADYQLRSLSVILTAESLAPNLRVSLREDVAGLPAETSIEILGVDPVLPLGRSEVTFGSRTRPILAAGTRYWVVLEPSTFDSESTAHDNAYVWHLATSGSTSVPGTYWYFPGPDWEPWIAYPNSPPETLRVRATPFAGLPEITEQPRDQRTGLGGTAIFTAGVTQAAGLRFQWKRDGVILPGARSWRLEIVSVTAEHAGSYTLEIRNDCGTTESDAASLTVLPADLAATHSLATAHYRAGGVVTLTNTFAYEGAAPSLTWQVLLPAGWSVAAETAVGALVQPAIGDTSLAEWQWTAAPASGSEFSYTLNVPAEASGEVAIAALVTASRGGEDFLMLADPDPWYLYDTHRGDTDRDGRIGLSELLRVIELYNTRAGTERTGAYDYRGDNSAADNFAPVEPSTATSESARVRQSRFHSADFDRDGTIGLSELLRLIEIYNVREGTQRTGEYHLKMDTVDGIAPGPASPL